jgi:hypothetical protein
MNDPVNHPAHYTNPKWPYEVIDLTEQLDFVLGNAVKYVLRAPYKGNEVEDLEKAKWYLDRYISNGTDDNYVSDDDVMEIARSFGDDLVLYLLIDREQARVHLDNRILAARVKQLEAKVRSLECSPLFQAFQED